MMFKIANNMVGINKEEHLKLIKNSRTRKNNNRNFQPIYARLNNYKFSFFPRTIQEWNTLKDNEVSAKTAANFKEHLHKTSREVD